MGDDPLDVDTERYLTLRDAMKHTRRSRPTILRWVKQGQVRTIEKYGVRGYNLNDLVDAEAGAHYRQAVTRRSEQ